MQGCTKTQRCSLRHSPLPELQHRAQTHLFSDTGILATSSALITDSSLLALKIHTSFRNQGANKESESPRLGVRSTGKERNGSSRTHGQHGHVSTAAYSQVDTSELCALATLNNHSDCRMTGSPPIQLELVSPCLCLLRACG